MGASIRPGTWNIPEHPQHRIIIKIIRKICKIQFPKTENIFWGVGKLVGRGRIIHSTDHNECRLLFFSRQLRHVVLLHTVLQKHEQRMPGNSLLFLCQFGFCHVNSVGKTLSFFFLKIIGVKRIGDIEVSGTHALNFPHQRLVTLHSQHVFLSNFKWALLSKGQLYSKLVKMEMDYIFGLTVLATSLVHLL